MSTRKGLTRDSGEAMIAGVCAGVARYYGWSVMGTRVVYVIVSALSVAFPGILFYLLLWLLLPKD